MFVTASTWFGIVAMGLLLGNVTAHCWSNKRCEKKHVGALRHLGPLLLKSVSPECFAKLSGLEETDLSSVIPLMSDNIFAHYNGKLSKRTAASVQGVQLAHFGEERLGHICEKLNLHNFTPIALGRMTLRCLRGALSHNQGRTNASRLPYVSDEVFAEAIGLREVCQKVHARHILRWPRERLGLITPECFAQMIDITCTDLSTVLPHLETNIFAALNVPLHEKTVASLLPEHLNLFGSQIRSKKLCELLDLRRVHPTTFAHISRRCLIGIYSGNLRSQHGFLLAHLPFDLFKHLMSNPRDICRRFPASALLHAPDEFGRALCSKCFSNMEGIGKLELGPKINSWPDNIFEFYDGPLREDQLVFILPGKMAHFAERREAPFSCEKLDLSRLPLDTLLAAPTHCITGFLRSGKSLGTAWTGLHARGRISKEVFAAICEYLTADDVPAIPQPYWDHVYDLVVQYRLLALYREHIPGKFKRSIRTNRVAFIWLAHALLSRGPKETLVLDQVKDLIAKYPTKARKRISSDLLYRRDVHWVERMVGMTFLDNFGDVEAVLIKRFVSTYSSHKTIDLTMKDGVFDFVQSYNKVQQQGHFLLDEFAELRPDGYIDAGAPMRLWVDQMLDYIVTYNLLEVTADGTVRLPFMADPSVGAFVSLVYLKAMQLRMRPPLPLDPSFLELFVSRTPETFGRYFERVYGPDLAAFASRVQSNQPADVFDQTIRNYQFLEPEEMQSRHPLRPLQSIFPESILDFGDNAQPSKVYDRESFQEDYMRRFEERCQELFRGLVSQFRQYLVVIFDLQLYSYLLDRSIIREFFGLSLCPADAIMEAMEISSDLAQTMIKSVVDPQQKIHLGDALESIIHSLGDRERARFVALMTGSGRVRLATYTFTVSSLSSKIEVPVRLAFAEDLFITPQDHDEILGRMEAYQARRFVENPGKSTRASIMEESFFGSEVASCTHLLRIRPQSSYALLLSIFQLLNLPPASMDDAMERVVTGAS